MLCISATSGCKQSSNYLEDDELDPEDSESLRLARFFVPCLPLAHGSLHVSPLPPCTETKTRRDNYPSFSDDTETQCFSNVFAGVTFCFLQIMVELHQFSQRKRLKVTVQYLPQHLSKPPIATQIINRFNLITFILLISLLKRA